MTADWKGEEMKENMRHVIEKKEMKEKVVDVQKEGGREIQTKKAVL